MADLFISYSRETDEELYDKPITRFVLNLEAQFKTHTGKPLDAFFDTKDLKVGVQWDRVINKNLEEAEFIIIFFSVSYFNSNYCLKELDTFLYPIKGSKHKKSRIIPIQISPVDIEYIDKDANKEYYRRIKDLNIIDFSKEFTSNKYDEGARAKIDEVIHTIKNPILDKKDVQIDNIQIFDKEQFQLLDFGKENYKSIKDIIIKKTPQKNLKQPVCVIYTGGTVGMIHNRTESKLDRNDLIQGKIEDIAEYFFKLKELKTDIHFFEIAPIDSSNATFNDWNNLAKLIEKIYDIYQGFVILHGANTMAYAASYLSFIFENLQKPIIFTGSENPLIDIDSDAELNVLRAVQIAAHKSRETAVVKRIPEVCIFYGDKLFRGNRATKYHAFNPSKGFSTLNSPEIGFFSNNRLNLISEIPNNEELDERTINQISSRLPSKEDLDKKIIILDIYPDMPIDDYAKMFENTEKIDGLILRTYGTGNPPDEPNVLLKIIKNLMKSGTVVVNTTQSPEGRVLIKLYENNASLFDLGVVNGGDMTREAAYTKLKWLLSTEPNLEKVKSKMQKNIRGELKYSSYNFTYNKSSLKQNEKNNYYLTSLVDIDSDLKRQEIDHAIIRITNVKILSKIDDYSKHTLNILYNPQKTTYEQIEKEGYEDSLLINYERVIGKDEDVFEKNIEVTFDFKQFFNPKQSAIQLGIFFDPPIQFEYKNLGLYIYTKSKS